MFHALQRLLVMSKTLMTVLAALFLSTFAGAPRTAEAGEAGEPTHGCMRDKLTGSVCWGSLRTFRHSPDPTAYFRFLATYATEAPGSANRAISARVAGVDYTCYFRAAAMTETLWTQLMTNPDVFFVIRWTTGECWIEQTTIESRWID